MFNDLRLAQPVWLYLSVLLLALGLGWALHLQRVAHLRTRWYGNALTSDRTRSARLRLHWTAACTILTAAILLISLARPQMIREEAAPIVRKLAVVFLLDISPSMSSRDLFPSRREQAVQFIRSLIATDVPIERAGLVTFSGSSIVLSYLTSDMESLFFYLDYLQDEAPTALGTNIGTAIRTGLGVFERARETNIKNAGQHRPLMIILSDGEDHGEELASALRDASREKIRIYTLGLASEAGGFVPVGVSESESGYLEDSQGRRLVSRLGEGSLIRIAEATGGRFYRLAEKEQFTAALRGILSREREIAGYEQKQEWFDLYPELLWSALGMSLLAWVLGRS